MDLDRPHFRTTSIGSSSATATTSDLFICFTSRLSSSSMKLTKSILSPGRAARDGAPVSLSSSLSRRLRTNGSLKGGASPFFATTGKKRGCGFENPEPSSPKVTCIGQVRVKTRKKVKQTRSLSRRRSGEVSFRKIEQGSCNAVDNEDKSQRYSTASAHYHNQHGQQEGGLPHRNQRWVHLPISICEALRAFGAEFSCLFPCKSSCFSSNEREKVEKQGGSGCGAVLARWLVGVNDGEGGKRREIEVVVGEEEMDHEARISMRSSRRHVFDDIEVKDDNRIEVKGESVGDEARVSICIPPKNALLLMRCRSDPMKMADLAHRFSWDASANAAKNETEVIQEEINCEDFEEQIRRCEGKYEEDAAVLVEVNEEQGEELIENEEVKSEMLMENVLVEVNEEQGEELVVCSEENGNGEGLENEMAVNEGALIIEEEVESNMDSFEALLDQESAEQYYEDCDKEEIEVNSPVCHLSSSSSSSSESDVIECNEAANTDVTNYEENLDPETTNLEDGEEETKIPAIELETENLKSQEFAISDEKPNKNQVLPDCLLLMMCEPKLSMEVSKETWVCSTDFIRWLPERPRKPAKGTKPGGCDHDPVKQRLSTDSKPKPITGINVQQLKQKQKHLQQPPRSSCSLPAAAMAAVIEQKLVNAVGYEPFVLTRCKSEPMRTAAAKLVPESCFWNNAVRNRPAAVGVGAAGIGF